MNGMNYCGNVVVAVVMGDGERGGDGGITHHHQTLYYYHHHHRHLHSESIYACNQLCQCHINIMTNTKQKKNTMYCNLFCHFDFVDISFRVDAIERQPSDK